jgi:flagellar hook assembly protein FlgD
MTYTLSYEATVRIQIRDPNNQVFHTLRRHEDGMLSAGAHTFEWDGRQSIYGPDGTIIQEGPSVQVEGIYTVEIQAISQTANATTAETKTTVQVLK